MTQESQRLSGCLQLNVAQQISKSLCACAATTFRSVHSVTCIAPTIVPTEQHNSSAATNTHLINNTAMVADGSNGGNCGGCGSVGGTGDGSSADGAAPNLTTCAGADGL